MPLADPFAYRLWGPILPSLLFPSAQGYLYPLLVINLCATSFLSFSSHISFVAVEMLYIDDNGEKPAPPA